MEVCDQRHASSALPSKKTCVSIERQAGYLGKEKHFVPLLEFEPRTFYPLT